MTDRPQKNLTFEVEATGQSKFVDRKMTNVKSDLIEITHDKLENILLKHEKNIGKSKSWITPLSIFITVLIAQSTTDFKDTYGITKDTWDAFFLLLGCTTMFWLIYSIIAIIQIWGKWNIDYLIRLIKKEKTPHNNGS